MNAFGNTRRDFLKRMGLGFAIPALVNGKHLSAGEKCKSGQVLVSRRRVDVFLRHI